jgi:putative ABC transport system permease protein
VIQPFAGFDHQTRMSVPSLRLSARRLGREWRFTLTAVVTLGLAIAANTVIFGAAYTVLLKPLPFDHADRLFVIWNGYDGGTSHASVSVPELMELAERSKAFERIAAVRDAPFNLTEHGEPLRLNGLRVSVDLGRVLGIRPMVGRDFDRADADTERVVLLSHQLWTQTFGADARVIGQTIQLNGAGHTIVGVLPRDLVFPDAPTFAMPRHADIWVPAGWHRLRGEPRGDQVLRVIGLAHRGVTEDAVRHDLDGIAAQFRSEHPNRYTPKTGWRLVAVPLREELVGASRSALVLLLGAAGLVLLIACTNLSNLIFSREAGRRRERGIKAALGASRFELVGDLVADAVLLGVLSGALGLALAAWSFPVVASAAPDSLPHIGEARLEPVTVLFAVVVALSVVMLAGLGPALAVGGRDILPSLRAERSGGDRRLWSATRVGLIVGEIALAFVVLALAGLLVQTSVQLNRADLGLSPGGAVSMHLSLPADRYPEAEHRAAFFGTLLDSLGRRSDIGAVALADPLPLSGEAWSGTLRIEEHPTPPGEPLPHAEFYRVSHGYLRTMGVRLLAGRDFTPGDHAQAPPVVLVDESFSKKYWPNGTALGRRVGVRGPDAPLATIVGIVGRVRRDGPRHAGEPQIYLPYFQSRAASMHLLVRPSASTVSPARLVREAVTRLDPALPPGRMFRLADLAARAKAPDRFNMLLVVGFAVCALVLAVVGLYGVTSYLVEQRTREFGIRIALGSTPGGLQRRVLAQCAVWAASGIALGTTMALLLARASESLLFEVSAFDVPTLGAAAAVTGFFALCAALVPARRALRTDPVQALRA